jgi:sugar phosphate isomerase/epimerase
MLLLVLGRGWKYLSLLEKEGVIQFDQVFKHLADRDFSGWLIVEAEQDPRRPDTASPLEYAQMAHKFVKSKIQQYSPVPATAAS